MNNTKIDKFFNLSFIYSLIFHFIIFFGFSIFLNNEKKYKNIEISISSFKINGNLKKSETFKKREALKKIVNLENFGNKIDNNRNFYSQNKKNDIIKNVENIKIEKENKIFTKNKILNFEGKKDNNQTKTEAENSINKNYSFNDFDIEILNDYADFENLEKDVLSQYLKDILKQIENNKFYPDIARNRKNQGNVDISFCIDKTGKIYNIDLLKKSDFKVLDNSAIMTIKKIRPKSFLEGMDVDFLRLKINLVYRLNF
jgi:TonB family protein